MIDPVARDDDAELALPEKNEYLPSSFDLVAKPPEQPADARTPVDVKISPQLPARSTRYTTSTATSLASLKLLSISNFGTGRFVEVLACRRSPPSFPNF